MDYGLQLYSVRDMMGHDMEGTLRAVSEIGYRYVEFCGFYGRSAKEVRELLDQYGLEVCSTHTSYYELREDFDALVAYHKTIGNREIIIPCANLGSAEGMQEFLDIVNKYQPKLAAEGIRLSYHNHAGELEVQKDGRQYYGELEHWTKLDFEVDTYWAYMAKVDPVALLDRLGERARFIHIKDGDAEGHGTPLGRGTAPVKDVWNKARAMGLTIVVESETQPDNVTEVAACFDYLKSLENNQ